MLDQLEDQCEQGDDPEALTIDLFNRKLTIDEIYEHLRHGQ